MKTSDWELTIKEYESSGAAPRLRLFDVRPRHEFSRALPAVDTKIKVARTDDRQFRVATRDPRLRFRLQLRKQRSSRTRRKRQMRLLGK